MAVAQNNQFTAIDFRYIKDDALLGNNEANCTLSSWTTPREVLPLQPT